ncbi:class I SAM-dependent methyltransferase [Sphingomonas bacterium]|uniref:class I SAM-dependent methyltransferase n=1 Tax=Sphingomonas bacterium TaxID=1895847 RepID=UPI0026129175|nr:class I SAM-dependent methyltransferase [Sphingomonas bacterium]MDB5677399.1 type 12 methyltransferase [Sphingomonas bacterium]
MADSYDPNAVTGAVKRGQHRKIIGGLWDELGQLQLDFLKSQGLSPSHDLLDVGCGSLRGGIKFIPYLDPGRYWGIDKDPTLLQVGWDIELAKCGLAARQPRAQLVCLDDFQFSSLGAQFDYAIAQSVFTHMPLNRIRRCLARLAPAMGEGGRFYATYFEIDDSQDREAEQVHVIGGMTSHSDRAFYHYSRRDMDFVVEDLPWTIDYIGDWGHPRDQKMLLFIRQ